MESDIRIDRKRKRDRMKEKGMQLVFLLAAVSSILAVVMICLFLFASGIPAVREIGILNFLAGDTWRPGNDIYGILPMILGSLYVTAGAIVIGVPVAVFTAVFLAFFCPVGLKKPFRAAIALMAGIPSVVYGFFGLTILVPFVRNVLGFQRGNTMLTASILLAVMILPTVVGVAEASLRSVPTSYYEGALALGATHAGSIFFTVLPAAKSGILTGIVLGIGRAIGETMAVIMVAGNQAVIPSSAAKGVRTLTANIVLEMGYASGLHREALIATGLVLFIFIFIINVAIQGIKKGDKS